MACSKISRDIGALDLKTLLGYQHCGTLTVELTKTSFFRKTRKTWVNRFVVVVKGKDETYHLLCYDDQFATRAEYVYSMKEFESVRSYQNKDDNQSFFSIRFEDDTKGSLIYLCGCEEEKENWIAKLSEFIDLSHQFSQDSGYGSGGSLTNERIRTLKVAKEHSIEAFDKESVDNYDNIQEVQENNFDSTFPKQIMTAVSPTNASITISSPSTNTTQTKTTRKGNTKSSFQQTCPSSSVPASDGNTKPKTIETEDTKLQHGQIVKELQLRIAGVPNRDKEDAHYTHFGNQNELNEATYVNVSRRHLELHGSPTRLDSTSSSYLQVTGEYKSIQETNSFCAVRESATSESQTNPYANRIQASDDGLIYENVSSNNRQSVRSNESDSSNGSDSSESITSGQPQISYEDDIYENTELFTPDQYMCDSREDAKRKLKGKPNGTFAIFEECQKKYLLLRSINPEKLWLYQILEKDGNYTLYSSGTRYKFQSITQLLDFYFCVLPLPLIPGQKEAMNLTKGWNAEKMM